MQSDLRSLTRKVETGEIRTHDEIRREFLNIVEEYLEEKYGLIAHVKLERDVADGRYDGGIGTLRFEIKSLDEGFEAGIDDSKDYVEGTDEDLDFFTTEGVHGAHINSDANVVIEDNLEDTAPNLRVLLDGAIREPSPDEIVDAFGPQSERVQAFIKTLWEILQDNRDLERVESAFETWQDIYAESANLTQDTRRAVQRQADNYGIDINNAEETFEFLFAVQTYFAIFLKLFSTRLTGDYDSVENRLARGMWPESFHRLSVETQIIEHDLFDWIIDPARESGEASDQLEDIVFRIANSVDFLNPDAIDQDILRDLYQNSFDSSTRTAMGEFYTNDELVNEILDQVGYEGAEILEDAPLLDPTCGSGTFLFHAVRRYIDAAENAGWRDSRIVTGATTNINGIDLHPFATAMARTNFLLALGERAEYVEDVPVYWTDSLAPAAQRTLNGQSVSVSTLGAVNVPDPDDIGHREVFQNMEKALAGRWSKNRFLEEFDEQDRQRYENTLSGVYRFFTEEIHNGMWVPAFRDVASVYQLKDECEFVVGNPPWVRRQNVESELRERLQEDFEYYSEPWRPDLNEMRNPPSPRDYSIAFVEAGFEFLIEGGTLGYVITSSLARALYAGKARQELVNERNLQTVIDYALSSKNLFPDATTTPLVVVASNEDPEGDADITLYNREDDTLSWEIDPENLPIETDDPRSPWHLTPPDVTAAFRKMVRVGPRAGDIFTPTSGIKTAANELYFVESVEPTEDDSEVLVETEAGDMERVEKDIIRPLIRGENLDEWEYEVETHILWTHDSNGDVLDELPERLDEYFEQHKERLENRRDSLVATKMENGAPYWVIGNTNAEKLQAKVGWQDIAKSIEAAYLPSKIDEVLETGVELTDRELIPTTKVLFFETAGNGVAKALTGALNSTPVRAYVGSYALRTGGRYCQHKAWTLGIAPIPQGIFDGEAETVTDIASELYDRKGDDELSEELDEEISELYGFSEEDLGVLKEFLDFFIAG